MPRRDYGTGSIRLRKDGRWEARLARGTAGTRKSYFGKTRREVQIKLAEGRRRAEQGLATSDQTLQAFLTHWLHEVAKPSVRPSSYLRYVEVVRLQILPALGHLKLSQLGVEPIQAMLNRCPGSPEKVRAVLRNALNVAVKWRLLSWNPAALADLPRWTPRPARWLELPEALRLLEVAKGTWLEPIVTLALATAIREGEILGLRWSDVDLSARTLTVNVQMQRGQLVPVKTQASQAPLPLPEIACRALRDHRDRHQIRSLRRLVFTTKNGTPYSARNLLRAFKRLLERADLPQEIRFHDLRHSTASLLVASGVDPITVQAILRHANVRTTLEVYSHAMPDTLREASQTLDLLLTPKKTPI